MAKCHKDKKEFEDSKNRLEQFQEVGIGLYGEKSVSHSQFFYELGMVEED